MLYAFCSLAVKGSIDAAILQASRVGSKPLRACAGLYDWPPFVIAPGFSVVGILLMAGLENAVGRQFLGQTTLEEIADAGSASDIPTPKELALPSFKSSDLEHGGIFKI